MRKRGKMALDDKNKKNAEEGGSESGTGSGGQGGKIEFRDFLATGPDRDDLLSSEEQRILLSQLADIHEQKVKDQKQKRDEYKNVKEGKVALQDFRAGKMGMGVSAQYKVNPKLANKAQFSGVDRQVNVLPTENHADTNENDRNELQDELRYRMGYQATPKFNPKPHGPY